MDGVRDEADDDPIVPTQADLEAILDESEADLAAGRVVPLEEVLLEMREVAEQVRTARVGGPDKRSA